MTRNAVLGTALVATLVLVSGVATMEDAAEGALVPPLARAAGPASPAGAASSRPATTARTPWPAPEILAAWEPPAPAAPPEPAQPVAAPAPPPPPPAFPYQWIGRLHDGRAHMALLGSEQGGLAVRAGDLVDGRWRIEQVAEDRLALTWLPTGQAVQLSAR